MWIFLSGAMRFISNLWSRRGKNLVGPKWLCWYEYHKPKVVKPSNPRQKSMAKPQTWPQALSYLVLVTLLSLSLFFLPILPTLNQPLSQSHSHTFRLRFWTLTWNFLWSVKKNMNLFIANINLICLSLMERIHSEFFFFFFFHINLKELTFKLV